MARKKFQDSLPVVNIEEDEISKSVFYRQVIGYDEDGNVIFDCIRRPRYQNGGGFVISYTEKICEFLSKVSTGSIVRVFMFIAHHQSYGNDGHYGFRCSHKFLEQSLNLNRATVWDALNYLKSKNMVNVSRIDGSLEFMVNPSYITIGADKKAREREWLRRLGHGVPLKAIVPVIPAAVSRPKKKMINLEDDVCEMN